MKKFFNEAKGHMMTGIGYMLPLIIGASLVVAIPLIIALCTGVQSLDPYAKATGFYHTLWQIQQVGWAGIGLVNTVLAGFIAYSIAEKPAIGAGLIGGAIASNYQEGFLGAVIAIVMGVILNTPLSMLNTALISWIRTMTKSGTNQVLLAIILGAMIGSDMGGPINKAAWMAGNVLMAEKIYQPNVYINCAICIPPLAYAISTVIKSKCYSDSFKDAGKGNWVMGFVGITEGAIPFTLVKASRLVPLNMIGCALGAAVTCLLGAKATIPPVGGIYGFITIGSGWAYLVGMLVGALFIAFVAPLLANFNVDPDSADETMTEDDVEISFE